MLMNRYSFEWMVNQFFEETVGIGYSSIKATILDRWSGGEEPLLKKLERSLYKV